MKTISNVHEQFAEYFNDEVLKPYAFLTSKKVEEGSICLDLENLSKDDCATLTDEYNISEVGLNALREHSLIALSEKERQPFVLFKNKMYLHRYFRYETIIIDRIKKFLANEKKEL